MFTTFKADIKAATSQLNDLQKKQIPYAASRALNDTAVDVQNALGSEVELVFDNKKVWWKKTQPTGIKVKFSDKRNLVSKVFSDAPFLPLQIDGGIKTPKKNKYIAIPTEQTPKSLQKAGGARKAIDQYDTFKLETAKGAVLFQRMKKKIKPLFVFSTEAKIQKRFKFYEISDRVAQQNFLKNFYKWLEEAIKTAK